MLDATDERDIRWVGSSYADLLAFPKTPRKEAGFQLGKVQAGIEPSDWKPFDEVGAGTREIRISDAKGIFRVMYVAKFEEAVYVLHCFQKRFVSKNCGRVSALAVFQVHDIARVLSF